MTDFDPTSLFLCLDQGGHASRALVLDGRGNVVTRALRLVATQYAAVDRVEHNAEEIVDSVHDAGCEAVSNLGTRKNELVAAGLATQRSSIVCWDRLTGVALSPVISWQDRRAHAWLASFESHASEIESRTGLRLSPHYGASKLRWCLDNLESVRAALRDDRLAFGPLASFLAYRLTAEHSLLADPANAQRTLLCNLAERNWDASLLQLFGVPPQALPACVDTGHGFGHIGIQDIGLPLTVMTGDQSAALFAFGEPALDVAYVNLGTGAFIQRAVTTPVHVDGLLTSIAYGDSDRSVYTLEGTVNGAASALAWAAQTLACPDLEAQLPDWLSAVAEPPLFLNGIGGLGAPYWAADFASRFVGDGDAPQKAVAVAESIVFLALANIERLQCVGPLHSLVLTGGLAKLDGLCQRLADLTGLPASRADEHEATARGLAWLLAGTCPDWPATGARNFVPLPNPALANRYRHWRTAMEQALG